MKSPSLGMLVIGGLGLTVLTLAIIGPPGSHTPPQPATVQVSREPAPATVSAEGFTLVSSSIELPIDDANYPDGLHAEIINANCTACHSASMAQTQPALSADQWRATVVKMRDVYKAPVADRDIAAIVAYLTAMPGQTTAPATGRAQDPDPKVAPDVSGSTG